MFLKFVAGLVLALILVVGFSQVILPLWQGKRLFPAFGRKARLERELERWREDEAERQLEQEIARRAASAFEVRPLDTAAAERAEPQSKKQELDHE